MIGDSCQKLEQCRDQYCNKINDISIERLGNEKKSTLNEKKQIENIKTDKTCHLKLKNYLNMDLISQA